MIGKIKSGIGIALFATLVIGGMVLPFFYPPHYTMGYVNFML